MFYLIKVQSQDLQTKEIDMNRTRSSINQWRKRRRKKKK